jgi:hypothetical protein
MKMRRIMVSRVEADLAVGKTVNDWHGLTIVQSVHFYNPRLGRLMPPRTQDAMHHFSPTKLNIAIFWCI